MSDIPAPNRFQLDLPPWPEVEFSAFGVVESVPLSRIQKLTAGFMSRNWVAIPHVTHNDDADITALENHRSCALSQELFHRLKGALKSTEASARCSRWELDLTQQ